MTNSIEEARRKAAQRKPIETPHWKPPIDDRAASHRKTLEWIESLKQYQSKAYEALDESGVSIRLKEAAEEHGGNAIFGAAEIPTEAGHIFTYQHWDLSWITNKVGDNIRYTYREHSVSVLYTEDDRLLIRSGLEEIALTRDQWKNENLLASKLDEAIKNPVVKNLTMDKTPPIIESTPGMIF